MRGQVRFIVMAAIIAGAVCGGILAATDAMAYPDPITWGGIKARFSASSAPGWWYLVGQAMIALAA